MIKLPLKRTKDRVFLTPEIAKQLTPCEIQPGTNLSTLTGYLQVKDNLHSIKVSANLFRQMSMNSLCRHTHVINQLNLSKFLFQAIEQPLSEVPAFKRHMPPTQEEILRKTKYEWGQVDVDNFIQRLKEGGIKDIKVDNLGAGSYQIRVLNDDAIITIANDSTHVLCNTGREKLRLKIRDLITKSLPSF